MATHGAGLTPADDFVTDVHRLCRELNQIVDGDLREASVLASAGDAARSLELLLTAQQELEARRAALDSLI